MATTEDPCLAYDAGGYAYREFSCVYPMLEPLYFEWVKYQLLVLHKAIRKFFGEKLSNFSFHFIPALKSTGIPPLRCIGCRRDRTFRLLLSFFTPFLSMLGPNTWRWDYLFSSTFIRWEKEREREWKGMRRIGCCSGWNFLLTVYSPPPYIKQKRESWNWRNVLAVWNLGLSIFSWMGAIRTVPHVFSDMATRSLRDNICVNPRYGIGAGSTGLWMFLFVCSKFPWVFWNIECHWICCLCIYQCGKCQQFLHMKPEAMLTLPLPYLPLSFISNSPLLTPTPVNWLTLSSWLFTRRKSCFCTGTITLLFFCTHGMGSHTHRPLVFTWLPWTTRFMRSCTVITSSWRLSKSPSGSIPCGSHLCK